MFNHLWSNAQLSKGDVKNKNIPLCVFVHETHPVHIYLLREPGCWLLVAPGLVRTWRNPHQIFCMQWLCFYSLCKCKCFTVGMLCWLFFNCSNSIARFFIYYPVYQLIPASKCPNDHSWWGAWNSIWLLQIHLNNFYCGSCRQCWWAYWPWSKDDQNLSQLEKKCGWQT